MLLSTCDSAEDTDLPPNQETNGPILPVTSVSQNSRPRGADQNCLLFRKNAQNGGIIRSNANTVENCMSCFLRRRWKVRRCPRCFNETLALSDKVWGLSNNRLHKASTVVATIDHLQCDRGRSCICHVYVNVFEHDHIWRCSMTAALIDYNRGEKCDYRLIQWFY